MRSVYCILLLYLCFATILTANTSANAIDISSSHHTIGEYASVYEDPTATLTLSDILKLPRGSFTPLNKPVSSHGFTNASFWYTFTVKNPDPATMSRLFVFEPAWLDHVQIAIISPKGEIQQYQGGNSYTYDKRSLDHYLTNIKHAFDPGESQVYIELRTRDPFIVSIALMEESTFLSEDSFYSLLIGLFYGGMIALLIYNLFLYFGMKKDFYLLYVLYLFSFLLVNSAYNGYLFMSIFSESPELQNWAQAILSYTFIIAALMFANSFLNLKKYHLKLYRSTRNLLYIIFTLGIFSALFGGYHYNIMFGIISVMFGSVYIAAIALYSWLHGNRSARFFLLGAMSGLIGVFITAATLLSLIPYTYYTFKASDFGMYIDIILLSLALPDRMKIIQEKRIEAEHNALTDALTGLHNRRAFYAISQTESKKLLRYEKDFSVMMLDIDNFKKINDTYGHHTGDRILELVATTIKENMRECDYVFRLGGDEFVLFLPETNEQEAYQLAERIQKNIAKLDAQEEDDTFPIHCSIGISEFKHDDNDIEVIVKRADAALYAVKNSGKNGARLHHDQEDFNYTI